MRLFFLCKQFCTRRDFIADRYGRLWHLPEQLARRGHQVLGVTGAYYRNHALAASTRFENGGTLEWISRRLLPYWPPDWLGFLSALREQPRGFAPDAVFASSDALHLGAGRWLAQSLQVPLVVDFYDNYESFGASSIPVVDAALRVAARAAVGTTFVSQPLREYLIPRYGLRAPSLILENGVDDHFFAVQSAEGARRVLGLPLAGRLIGTAGALDASRGIQVLYDAFEKLAIEQDNLFLVLAGEPREPPPRHPRVLRLGTLSPDRMPLFWKALDVAAICLRDDAFGRYCFPLKLAEIAAVGTPLVFPAIGVFAAPDAAQFGTACASANAADFASAIRRQLAQPRAAAWRPPTWGDLGKRLEQFLLELS